MDWVNRKIQAIHWLYKLFGNFHSSTVLLCLCVQEESHRRGMPQAPLAELPFPLAPSPPYDVGLLFGRARNEPVGVRAWKPSFFPRAGLDRVIPHVPGPRWAEGGPWCLFFQWAPFPHTTWNTAGADLLTDVSQVVRYQVNSHSAEWTLDASEPASSWSCSEPGPCSMAAVCLAASTAVMPVSWSVCVAVCLDHKRNSVLIVIIAQEKYGRDDGEGSGKTHKDFAARLHCCLKSDRTEVDPA